MAVRTARPVALVLFSLTLAQYALAFLNPHSPPLPPSLAAHFKALQPPRAAQQHSSPLSATPPAPDFLPRSALRHDSGGHGNMTGGEGTCSYKATPSATTLAGSIDTSLYGLTYSDPRSLFFRFALGWDSAKIAAERAYALKKLNRLFGLTPASPGIVLDISVFNVTLRVVSRSEEANPCADIVAYLGGFTASGTNVSYGGEFARQYAAAGGQGVGADGRLVLPGSSSVAQLFIVAVPGTPDVRVLSWITDRPMVCSNLGLCGATGPVTFRERPGELLSGRADMILTSALIGDRYGWGITLSGIFPGYLPAEPLGVFPH